MSNSRYPSAEGPILAGLYWGAGIFVFVEMMALAFPSIGVLAAVISVVLFVAGTIAMGVALVIAAQLSRDKLISVADVFLLQQGVSTERRIRLLGTLVLEIVVGLGAAIADPTGGVVFGVLAPIHALGFIGLWAVCCSEFADLESEL
ncbi:MAG: hypothetical protein ACC652_00910 [Acidimicrobiales bacterium]